MDFKDKNMKVKITVIDNDTGLEETGVTSTDNINDMALIHGINPLNEMLEMLIETIERKKELSK